MFLLCHIINKLFHQQISAYLYNSHNHPEDRMRIDSNESIFLGLLCMSIILLISAPTYSGFASAQNNTLMQPDGILEYSK
jgi:hypothetical protein